MMEDEGRERDLVYKLANICPAEDISIEFVWCDSCERELLFASAIHEKSGWRIIACDEFTTCFFHIPDNLCNTLLLCGMSDIDAEEAWYRECLQEDWSLGEEQRVTGLRDFLVRRDKSERWRCGVGVDMADYGECGNFVAPGHAVFTPGHLDEFVKVLAGTLPTLARTDRIRAAWTRPTTFSSEESLDLEGMEQSHEIQEEVEKAANLAYVDWMVERRATALRLGLLRWASAVIARTISNNLEAIKQRLWKPDGALMSRRFKELADDYALIE